MQKVWLVIKQGKYSGEASSVLGCFTNPEEAYYVVQKNGALWTTMMPISIDEETDIKIVEQRNRMQNRDVLHKLH